MKKKIFAISLVSMIAIAAGWNFNQSKSEVELSDLALANVETLAYNGKMSRLFAVQKKVRAGLKIYTACHITAVNIQ